MTRAPPVRIGDRAMPRMRIDDLPIDVLPRMLLSIVDERSFGAAASTCASWHACVADLQARTRGAKLAQGVEVHPYGRFTPTNIAHTLSIEMPVP